MINDGREVTLHLAVAPGAPSGTWAVIGVRSADSLTATEFHRSVVGVYVP